MSRIRNHLSQPEFTVRHLQRLITLLAILLLPAMGPIVNSLSADITLPKIFSDHMVLQRKVETKVWGWAQPNEKLMVTFGEFAIEAQANEAGEWSALIPPRPAGGPFELTITGDDASVVVRNVFVGEVWLCSGELNMEHSIAESLDCKDEAELNKKMADLANQNIRFFRVGHAALEAEPDDLTEPASWQLCTPEATPEFSAISYYFAAHLLEQMNVAEEFKNKNIVIGLIDASWRGSTCEAWISKESLESNDKFAPLLEHWKDNETLSESRPSTLYNGMIGPISDYEICGTIWYQGESNVGRGEQYQALLPTLISDWRQSFGETMPFYLVQLTPYRYNDFDPKALAEIWEAQLKTHQSVNRTGLVVTTDLGKTDQIIPDDMAEIGRRLSLWASADAYKLSQELICSGPIVENISFEDGEALITFDNVGLGLESEEHELTCFLAAGSDGQFVEAKAMIVDKNAVRVSSSSIDEIAAIRFAWNDAAKPNLKNSGGLPASPFRSDDFELISKGIHF